MAIKRVKDIMIPLEELPAIPHSARLIDAITVLDKAQERRAPKRHSYRTVLVLDDSGIVIGKLDLLAFLRAIEPERTIMKDERKLSSAGVSDQYIDTMLSHYHFFENSLSDLCLHGLTLTAKDAMSPITDTIDGQCSLVEAVHRFVMREKLSFLVVSQGQTIGLLRLYELYDEIAAQLKIVDQMKQIEKEES
jgi:hypothetical protein